MSSQLQNVSLDDLLNRLTDPATMEDPGDYYAFLRQDAPVLVYPTEHLNTHFGASHLCFVSRYAEARQVMAGPAFQAPDLTGLYPTGTGSKVDQLGKKFTSSIFNVSPAEHSQSRNLLTRYFSGKHIETLRKISEHYSRNAVQMVLERLSGGAEVDLHSELSEYVACNTFAAYLGVPESDWPLLQPPADIIVDVAKPVVDQQDVVVAADALDTLITYFLNLAKERRRAPREDLTSELVSFADQAGIDDTQVADMLWGLWTVGFANTAASIDSAVVRTIRHPAEAKAIGGAPDGVRNFVTETSRIDPPLLMTGAVRAAVTDTELGGVSLPRGTQAIVLIGAVNRDPDVFDRPDAFIPERGFSRPMTFGHGVHYCIGERLAQMEVSIVLEQLYHQLPSELVIREAVWRRSGVRRAFEQLIVSL